MHLGCSALLAALLMMGCESIVDIDVPAGPSTLALYGFASPDSILRVDLYRTADMDEPTSTDALRVTDALVTLVTPTRRDTLSFASGAGYRSQRLPSPGETYLVEVSRPGYASIAAETTVPARPRVSVRTRKVGVGYLETMTQYEITISLDDPEGEHYYRIGCYKYIPPDKRAQDREWREVSFSSSDLILRRDPADVGGQRLESEPPLAGTVYVSDATFEGTTREFILRADVFDWDLPLQAKLVVTSMGKDYFEYHRDLALQRRNVGDPFAEPVALFSNVRDGEGIFGSYANRSIAIRLR